MVAARELWADIAERGGISINWEYIGLPREQFHRFLEELLREAGFPVPVLVEWEKTAVGGARIDWNRMRISARECRFHGVEPSAAVSKIKAWLASEHVADTYGLRFLLLDGDRM